MRHLRGIKPPTDSLSLNRQPTANIGSGPSALRYAEHGAFDFDGVRMRFTSAVVYIWYPEGENVGHAAMYLGDPTVGRVVEQRYDQYVNPVVRKANISLLERFNENYVSWWPLDGAGMMDKKPQARKFFLEEDIVLEQSDPHVVYEIDGLDLAAMRTAWFQIKRKQGAHYQMFRKSCATVVLRVLKAGGAFSKISGAKALWLSHNSYVTPKNVAQLCNELRDAGHATKSKNANCPEKGPFRFGLR
jgi:hypothetical protein